MAYTVIITDKMSGTYDGSKLVSARYYEDEKEAAIENGSVVLIGEYVDGEREIRKATTPEKDTAKDKLAIVASDEVDKSKSYNALDQFINEAGSNLMCYRLDGQFSVSKEAFVAGSVLAKNSVVELDGSNKLKAVATATQGSTQIGTIIRIDENGFYLIEA